MVTITICAILNFAALLMYLKAKFESNELKERVKDLEVKNEALTGYYESTININKAKR